MNIEIRPAAPEDVSAAVPLIYSSGPACFDYVFSHRTKLNAQEFLRKAFQKRQGEFGYANHIVATLDGHVVGTGAGFCGREMPAFSIAAFTGIVGGYGLRQAAGVLRRGLQVESIVRPPSGNLHYIAHLGVTPELRGQGIGVQLVEHLLEMGRERGRRTAALDVSVENPRAEALYLRMGFIVTAERVSGFKNETARVPNHRRMERPI